MSGRRNKDKYPRLPSEYSDGKIKSAVEEAGSVRDGAKLLGVCEMSLYGTMRRLGIRVKLTGGNKSRFDWEAIEKEWRARPTGTIARRFAKARGIESSYFCQKATSLGFYGAPPENGRLVTAPKARRGLRFDGIDAMTRENKARATAALARIKARDIIVELIRNEKNVHAAAMGSARAKTKAKFAEGMAQ